MENSLAEGSKSYHNEVEVYDLFSNAEDYLRKIESFLLPKIKNKVVLYVGCGSGKYAKIFTQLSRKYIGLDISKEQLRIAKEKTKNLKHVQFINSSAEYINLQDNSIDLIIATWSISTIQGFDRKEKVFNEMLRVLKNGGKIYLVENALGGEFEKIRGRFPKIKRTKEYNDWVINQGFKISIRFDTYFKFESLDIAKKVIGAIWGDNAKEKVKDNKIEHRIVIFSFMK